MKIRIEVEVEATELREFLGLPDVSGLQEEALDALSRGLRKGTEGLDPVQLREVRDLIGTLAADCGVILSSHILSEVQATCTKVAIMRDGQVLHHARL